MMTPPDNPRTAADKQRVALYSVMAATGLTVGKAVVGWFTGSLGILSEAAHSGLDLVAAIVTLLAVRIADKPADARHHYGHGKFENMAALFETLLLFVTCAWIIREGLARLFGHHANVTVNVWSFAVVLGSISVDMWRSRALMRAAKEFRSDALEADAIHFSSDIWSSCAVLVGLTVTLWSSRTGHHAFGPKADAAAALCVAAIIIGISLRLGSRTLDTLLDRAPAGSARKVREAGLTVPNVLEVESVRVRSAGPQLFVELHVHIDRNASLAQSHATATSVEAAVQRVLPNADVTVHMEPGRSDNEWLPQRIAAVARDNAFSVHNIVVHEDRHGYLVDLDLELDAAMPLGAAHDAAEDLEACLLREIAVLDGVTVHLEGRHELAPGSEDITAESHSVLDRVTRLFDEFPELSHLHHMKVRRGKRGVQLSLHCRVNPDMELAAVHALASQFENRIRDTVPELDRIVVHTEPERWKH